ncbi:MAG TPA: hypothetical protein VMD30_11965 [Tepidisphaeraceae bacterium]|nr:hypothetical protein [Tepidisphaeraceae bacterium]
MPAYTAYGLRIESDIPLPGLISHSPDSGPPDLLIRRGPVDPSPADGAEDVTPPSDEVCRRASAEEICIHYEGLATLLIRRGKEITVDPVPDAPAGLIRLALLGPAFGAVLHQRGFLVLHASAVRIGQKTVAFVGDKGAGKSTTAAAFTHRGYSLVADDIVAVEPRDFLVHPAFPLLKVWSETARHFRASTSDLEQFHPSLEKFALPASDQFSAVPAKLAAVFSLYDGPTLSIDPLSGQAAFMELVKHSYLLSLLRSTQTAAAHFKQAVHVAGGVPICRLVRPRSLPALDDILAAVVDHVA